MCSDHNGTKLELIMERKLEKSPITWQLNNMFLNNWCVKEQVSREIRKYFELNENANTTYKKLVKYS